MHQIGLRHPSVLDRLASDGSERGFLNSPTPFEYHTKNKQHTCEAPVTHSDSCVYANREIKKTQKLYTWLKVQLLSHFCLNPIPLRPQPYTRAFVTHQHAHVHIHTHTHSHSHTAMTPWAFGSRTRRLRGSGRLSVTQKAFSVATV